MIAQPIRDYVTYLLRNNIKPSEIAKRTGLRVSSVYAIRRSPTVTGQMPDITEERKQLKSYIMTQVRGGATLQAIGDKVGLTRERVRQLRNRWMQEPEVEYEALSDKRMWASLKKIAYAIGLKSTILARKIHCSPETVEHIFSGEERYIKTLGDKATNPNYPKRKIRLSITLARTILEQLEKSMDEIDSVWGDLDSILNAENEG